RWKPAALFAVPVAGIFLVFLAQILDGLEQIAVLLITPSSALTTLILVCLLGAWRLIAIADSMIGFGIRSPWRQGPTAATFAGLAAVVIVSHLAMAYFAWAFY